MPFTITIDVTNVVHTREVPFVCYDRGRFHVDDGSNATYQNTLRQLEAEIWLMSGEGDSTDASVGANLDLGEALAQDGTRMYVNGFAIPAGATQANPLPSNQIYSNSSIGTNINDYEHPPGMADIVTQALARGLNVPYVSAYNEYATNNFGAPYFQSGGGATANNNAESWQCFSDRAHAAAFRAVLPSVKYAMGCTTEGRASLNDLGAFFGTGFGNSGVTWPFATTNIQNKHFNGFDWHAYGKSDAGTGTTTEQIRTNCQIFFSGTELSDSNRCIQKAHTIRKKLDDSGYPQAELYIGEIGIDSGDLTFATHGTRVALNDLIILCEALHFSHTHKMRLITYHSISANSQGGFFTTSSPTSGTTLRFKTHRDMFKAMMKNSVDMPEQSITPDQLTPGQTGTTPGTNGARRIRYAAILNEDHTTLNLLVANADLTTTDQVTLNLGFQPDGVSTRYALTPSLTDSQAPTQSTMQVDNGDTISVPAQTSYLFIIPIPAGAGGGGGGGGLPTGTQTYTWYYPGG